MKSETKLIHAGREDAKAAHIVNVPLFRASTVLFDDVADMDHSHHSNSRRMTYGRRGTPTLWSLQDAFADAHNAAGALACPSGIAAVTTACLSLLGAGDHALFADNVYGPTRILAKGLLPRMGIKVDFYDPMIGADIAQLIQPNTKVILLESPGSQTFEVQDAQALVAVARMHGIRTIIDNTWASPIFFKPLDIGIDVVVESATKFICGHSDANCGLIAANADTLAQILVTHGDSGQTCGPDDTYAAQRGLRTLAVRMERHQSAALDLAHWLKARADVRRVLHPALPDCPGHEFWKRDFKGSSSLFSIIVPPAPRRAIAAMIDGLKHFGLGYSYGGFESLAIPQSPRSDRTATKWIEDGQLIRIHVGFEHLDDLKADLSAGFDRLKAACET
jgi:cystathionine beta-lyase